MKFSDYIGNHFRQMEEIRSRFFWSSNYGPKKLNELAPDNSIELHFVSYESFPPKSAVISFDAFASNQGIRLFSTNEVLQKICKIFGNE